MPDLNVQSTTPAFAATDVARNATIQINFKETTNLGSGSLILTNGQGDSRRIAIHDKSQVQLINSKNDFGYYHTLTIDPQADLLGNSTYYLLLDEGALKDEANKALPGITNPNSYRFHTSADFTPPQLISSQPANHSTNIAVDAGIELTFNEPVKFTGQGEITLTNDLGEVQIFGHPLTYGYVNESSMRIFLPEILKSNTRYFLSIPANAITDNAGNAFTGVQNKPSVTFTTGDWNTSTSNPSLTSLTWSNSAMWYAIDVAPTSNLILSASSVIKAGTGYITLSNGLGDTRRINIQDTRQVTFLPNQRRKVLIKPTQALWPNSSYTLFVDPLAITDLGGKPYAADANEIYTFKVGAIDNTPPKALAISFADSSTPEQIAFDDSLNRQKVALRPRIMAAFNEQITLGSGNITISNGQGDTRTFKVSDLPENKPLAAEREVSFYENTLSISLRQDLLRGTHYFILADPGIVVDKAGNPSAGVNDRTLISFDTLADQAKPTQELNHTGGLVGRYEAGDTLVFNFSTPISSYESFELNQHSFGGNDVIISADGLSASVVLNADSTVAAGDRLTIHTNNLGKRLDFEFIL